MSNFAIVTTKKNEKLQIAFGGSSLKNIHVWQLHKKISGGRDAVQDYNLSGAMAGKRAHQTIALLKKLINNHWHLTIKKISTDTSLSFGMVQAVLNSDLGTRRILEKFAPQLFTADQIQHGLHACFTCSPFHSKSAAIVILNTVVYYLTKPVSM